MIGAKPKFFDSPYFVMEVDNWHLKEGAPADVVKEFNDYMNGGGLLEDEEKPVKKSFSETVREILHK